MRAAELGEGVSDPWVDRSPADGGDQGAVLVPGSEGDVDEGTFHRDRCGEMGEEIADEVLGVRGVKVASGSFSK